MASVIEPAPLRIGIAGVGAMGRNHARVLAGMRDVRLVGVVDSNEEQARSIAETYNCQAFTHIEDLVGKVDAVTVAVPSVHHAAVGGFFLDNGIHCMIEKPLATTEADCVSLIEAAERRGLILMVGHIERFNPAVQQLKEILEGGVEVFAIEARRMSRVSQRIKDVNVIQDLMIHDIDVVLEVAGRQKVVSVVGQTVATPSVGQLDHVIGMLGFASGTSAVITASRIAENIVRELTVATELGFILLNYRSQTVQIFRQPQDVVLTPRGNYRADVSIEQVMVRGSEPLHNELVHFVQAVQTGSRPRVDGRQALEAIRLAWQIQDRAVAGRPRV